MSHYTVTVVLPEAPKSAGHVDEMLEPLLAPFDENIEVEEYKDYVRPLPENWVSMESRQLTWPWSHIVEDTEIPPEDLDAVVKHLSNEDERYGCDEKGLFQWSTYNPQSKWDWYAVGGRWSGFYNTTVDEQPVDYARKGTIFIPEGTNVQTYAVLAEGVWRSPGKMGWFGMSTEEDTEREDYGKWFDRFWAGLGDEAWVVVVDLHI